MVSVAGLLLESIHLNRGVVLVQNDQNCCFFYWEYEKDQILEEGQSKSVLFKVSVILCPRLKYWDVFLWHFDVNVWKGKQMTYVNSFFLLCAVCYIENIVSVERVTSMSYPSNQRKPQQQKAGNISLTIFLDEMRWLHIGLTSTWWKSSGESPIMNGIDQMRWRWKMRRPLGVCPLDSRLLAFCFFWVE